MKITQRFGLGASQHEVDFVDIDPTRDTPLFLDPFFIGIRSDSWSLSASQTIQNFFQTFVDLVRAGDTQRARALFNHLHEPNETCLGLSQGNPQGRAIGQMDGDALFESVVQSSAIDTGVVEDLEDFRLFIPGIDKDKISDITTNVIRYHLVQYTINQCRLWGIPMDGARPTGFYWNPAVRQWENGYEPALVIDGKKILLTPKAVVSYVKKYTPAKYHSGFVLDYLQNEHLAMGSTLVQHRKDGTPYVTKESLKARIAPLTKAFLSEFTANHPSVFADFKDWVKRNSASIHNYELSNDDPRAIADFLVSRIQSTAPGGGEATAYHRICVGSLELLLYPNLVSPIVEMEINDGRKRIDIVFDNAAQEGFFHRIHTVSHVPSQFISVECKNYSKEVANPELDQLIGRFSVNHGCVGILMFRSVDNMDRLLERCSDAWLANRHVIIPICDADLITLLSGPVGTATERVDQFFNNRYRQIAMRQPTTLTN